MGISCLVNGRKKNISLVPKECNPAIIEGIEETFGERTLEQRHPSRRDVDVEVVNLSKILKILMDEKNNVYQVHNTHLDDGITIGICIHYYDKYGKEHIAASPEYKLVY